jgi:hypothetical protein
MFAIILLNKASDATDIWVSDLGMDKVSGACLAA